MGFLRLNFMNPIEELEKIDKVCKALIEMQRLYYLPHDVEWERISLTLVSLEQTYRRLYDKYTRLSEK